MQPPNAAELEREAKQKEEEAKAEAEAKAAEEAAAAGVGKDAMEVEEVVDTRAGWQKDLDVVFDGSVELRDSIHAVMKQVHPTLNLGPDPTSIIVKILRALLENIVASAATSAAVGGGTSAIALKQEHLKDAVKAVLKGELAQHGLNEGEKCARKLDGPPVLGTPWGDNLGLQFKTDVVQSSLKLFRHKRPGGKQCAVTMAKSALVFTTALLEYMCAEVLELSGNAHKDNEPLSLALEHVGHVRVAVVGDKELLATVVTHCQFRFEALGFDLEAGDYTGATTTTTTTSGDADADENQAARLVLRAAPPSVTTRLTGSGSVLVQQYKSRHMTAPNSFGHRIVDGKRYMMEENGGWSSLACAGYVGAVVTPVAPAAPVAPVAPNRLHPRRCSDPRAIPFPCP